MASRPLRVGIQIRGSAGHFPSPLFAGPFFENRGRDTGEPQIQYIVSTRRPFRPVPGRDGRGWGSQLGPTYPGVCPDPHRSGRDRVGTPPPRGTPRAGGVQGETGAYNLLYVFPPSFEATGDAIASGRFPREALERKGNVLRGLGKRRPMGGGEFGGPWAGQIAQERELGRPLLLPSRDPGLRLRCGGGRGEE